MISYSIIIPTYNEKDNIKELIPKIKNEIGSCRVEIIIVDDNSPDGTADMAQKLGAKVLRRKHKLGLTSAVMHGVEKARGEWILIMDADLSHPPEMISKILTHCREYDIIIGSRNIDGGSVEKWPVHRKVISKAAEKMAILTLGLKVSDPMSGFFACRTSVLKKTRIKTRGYKLLMNVLAYNKNLRIKEVPYIFRDRKYGQTKLGTGEYANYIWDLVSIKIGGG